MQTPLLSRRANITTTNKKVRRKETIFTKRQQYQSWGDQGAIGGKWARRSPPPPTTDTKGPQAVEGIEVVGRGWRAGEGDGSEGSEELGGAQPVQGLVDPPIPRRLQALPEREETSPKLLR